MMNLEHRRNSNAANALQILHTSIYSSNEALSDLQQYISHLEELLTIELGAEEFARRLESLQSRDNESLFIPEDTSRPRKRSGSVSSKNGSSPKKSRSNSLASSLSHVFSLGRSILDKPNVAQSNVLSPDVSPKTSRKPSVAEVATANDQEASVQKMALRSAHPVQQLYRAPQAVMLPNVQPSANFHNRPGLPLTAKSPQDLATAQCPQTQPSIISTTRDSTQPGRVSQSICSVPMPSVKGGAFANPCQKPIAHKLPKKPTFSAAQFALSANKPSSSSAKLSASASNASSFANKSSHSSTKLSSSADNQTSPRSEWSQSKTPFKSVSKPSVRKLPKQSADSAARFTFSAEKLLSIAHDSSSSSTKLSSSANTASSPAAKAASPASKLPSSVNRPSPPSTKSSPSTNRPRKPSPSLNNPPSASKPSDSSLGESTSVARKPCRAVKKG